MWETVWQAVTGLLFLEKISLEYRGHCNNSSERKLMFQVQNEKTY